MTPSQKTVAIGALSGIVAMALCVWLLQALLPPPPVMASAGEQVAYALQWNALRALPLFAMAVAVLRGKAACPVGPLG